MWSIQNGLNLKDGYVANYNILNIVVNTERVSPLYVRNTDYNILNIVVNTEQSSRAKEKIYNYNILNIVVNTEP